MNPRFMRLVAIAGAFLLSTCIAVDVNAQCCGLGGSTSFYAPASTSFYAPATVTTYHSGGWYPGYWMDRVRTRLWGSPTTYVASYAPAQFATFGHTTSYAPTSSSWSGCSTCFSSPCSSCSSCTPQVTLSPVSFGCETCGATCPSSCGCTNGGATEIVNQASYQQSSGCSTCSGSTSAPPSTYSSQTPASSVPQPDPAPGVTNTPSQTPPAGSDPAPNYNTNRPAESPTPPAGNVQPEPSSEPKANESKEVDPYKVEKSDNSTYLEAPKLFNPKDRTARNSSVAPVRTAVYQQPVANQHASVPDKRGPITAAQATANAAGWTSGN